MAISKTLDKNERFSTCISRQDGVRFIQNGHGYDGAGNLVGKLDKANELTKSTGSTGNKTGAKSTGSTGEDGDENTSPKA